MKQALYFVSLLFVIGFMVSGCASTNMVSRTDNSLDFADVKTCAVSVDTKVPDSEKEAQALKELSVKMLQQSHKEVLENGAIRINVTITSLDRVSVAARLVLGAFAGKASTKADVLVKDMTGNVIKDFSIDAKTGSTGYSGVTGTSIKMATDKIIAGIQGRKE